MTKDDYSEALAVIGSLARMAQSIQVDEFLAQIDTAESIGPLLDPTLYRKFLHDQRVRADNESKKGNVR
jgi:hypothetical protein